MEPTCQRRLPSPSWPSRTSSGPTRDGNRRRLQISRIWRGLHVLRPYKTAPQGAVAPLSSPSTSCRLHLRSQHRSKP
jgi:hypothetical protein